MNTRLYGLSDLTAAEDMGVLKLRRQPYLDLTGRNIILELPIQGSIIRIRCFVMEMEEAGF